jgi:hypothetical protein
MNSTPDLPRVSAGPGREGEDVVFDQGRRERQSRDRRGKFEGLPDFHTKNTNILEGIVILVYIRAIWNTYM